MKFTEHIAVEEIKKESPRKMVIEEDSFLEELVDNSEPDKKTGKKSSSLPFLKGLRFILIMAALIVSITFVLNYSFIYLKDIILNKTSYRSIAPAHSHPRNRSEENTESICSIQQNSGLIQESASIKETGCVSASQEDWEDIVA